MTISVCEGEELLGSGTYSLAEYAYNIGSKVPLYKYDEATQTYKLDASTLTDGKYSQAQRSYQLVFAYMAFSEAAYNYKTN